MMRGVAASFRTLQSVAGDVPSETKCGEYRALRLQARRQCPRFESSQWCWSGTPGGSSRCDWSGDDGRATRQPQG